MENNTLGSSIAIMNAKGGVGKSTVTLAIAETLSYYYGKKVLVIDSDAQMSISVMLMPFDELNQKRAKWKTLVGLLHQTLILGQAPDWKEFITLNVSDVDDTETIDLLPGDLRLTLVERAVTEADRHEQMRGLVRSVLAEARLNYDYILIDCPPGLSLLTEIWLREADYHLAPAKPDFLAIAGLEMFREFKKINPDLKMAENLGILVNMKNMHSSEDDNYHMILENDEESRCFPDAIPHMAPIQHAARFNFESRSFVAKYPGSAGEAFRNTVYEILRRTGDVVISEAEESVVEEVAVEPEIVIENVVVEPEILVEEIVPEVAPEMAPPEVFERLQPEPEMAYQPEVSMTVAPPQPMATPGSVAMTGAAGIASRFAPQTGMPTETSEIVMEKQPEPRPEDAPQIVPLPDHTTSSQPQPDMPTIATPLNR